MKMPLFFSTTVLKASLFTEKDFSRFSPPERNRETAAYPAKSVVPGNGIRPCKTRNEPQHHVILDNLVEKSNLCWLVKASQI